MSLFINWFRERRRVFVLFLTVATTIGLLIDFRDAGTLVLIGFFVALIVLAVALKLSDFLHPFIGRNARGVSLRAAVRDVGLFDVENRNSNANTLPPAAVYQQPITELVMTGVSLAHAFHTNVNEIVAFLDSGRDFYAAFLHPDSVDVGLMKARHARDIRQDILGVLQVIANRELYKHQKFHLRLFKAMPPFTAIMSDGDVSGSDSHPHDTQGMIRVQPGTAYSSQHAGPILVFQKKHEGAPGGFEYFAADLRVQWREAHAASAEMITSLLRADA